jgi:hypothetical protein
VGEHRLRWRFAPGAVDSVVTVVGRGGRLTVTLYGWRDPWMALSGVAVVGDTLTLTTAAVNDPPVIGPGFVQAAVVQALARGWDPQARARGDGPGPRRRRLHRRGCPTGRAADTLFRWREHRVKRAAMRSARVSMAG